MPTVTLRYRLPEEQAEYDAARLGSEAMSVLWQIDQRCRSLLKHGEPTPEQREFAEEPLDNEGQWTGKDSGFGLDLASALAWAIINKQ